MSLKVFGFLFLFFSSSVFADDLLKAPPSFTYSNYDYVFIDLQRARYDIHFDIANKQAYVTSTLDFITKERGFVLFDLKPTVESASLNGKSVNVAEIPLPKNESWMKAALESIPAGVHRLVLTNRITSNISFGVRHVDAGFWMSDLSDRNFLEGYLPINLEYDQTSMEIAVRFTGTSQTHMIYTNALKNAKAGDQTVFTYPEHFTASSLFFHVTKKNKFTERSGYYKSIDGRLLPVTVYGKWLTDVDDFFQLSINTLAELENDYGPFPHHQLLVYATTNGGGMEYCGATITSYRALEHEITHSYFARGVKPVNGNSGWIDEAIASWRDKGYYSKNKLSVFNANMASRSVYRRKTDRAAYTSGADFMAHLNSLMAKDGGLKPFLAHLANNYMFQSISNEDFIQALNDFSGIDYRPVFAKYIYKKSTRGEESKVYNPYHPPITEAYLKSLL